MEHEPVQGVRDVTQPLAEPIQKGTLSRVVGRFLERPEAPERDASDLPGFEGQRQPGLIARIATAVFSYRFSFIALVLIPSLVATLYLAFVASDQYAAEARFAVRAAQFEEPKETKSALAGAASGGIIPSLAGQDAYVIASYIRSAAVFADLPPNLDPRIVYSRPEADFWARLSPNASLERLTDYWRSMVTTYVDGPSGVVTVSVRAFRPGDARDLAAAVVAASEKLVNAMSERARRDAMKEAEAEVKRTEAMVSASLKEERAYRDRAGWTDPGAQATSASTLLLAAMAERIRLQNDYFVDFPRHVARGPDARDAEIAARRDRRADREAQGPADQSRRRPGHRLGVDRRIRDARDRADFRRKALYPVARRAGARAPARRAAERLHLGVRAGADAGGGAVPGAGKPQRDHIREPPGDLGHHRHDRRHGR